MITVFVLCLGFGILAGTLSGVFGVGGGVVFVPALMFCFDYINVSEVIFMRLVLGTSLSCILITTLNSSWSHYRRGNIDWGIFKKLVVGIIIGVLLGGQVASHLSSQTLKLFFAIFLLLVTVKMWMGLSVDPMPRKISVILYWIVGSIIGFKSAILGIGGGTISVPFLSWTGKKIKEAVGVSASLGVVISFIGTITYAYNGFGNPLLPEYSFGYIYLPAFFGIAFMSSIFAHVGAKISDRVPQKKLYKAFSIFIALIMVKTFYGVFINWQ